MVAKFHFMNSEELAKLLPWVPDNALRVVIDIHMNDPVLVYMELIADADELTVNALAGLTGGEVVTVSPKTGEAMPAQKVLDTSSKTDKLK